MSRGFHRFMGWTVALILAAQGIGLGALWLIFSSDPEPRRAAGPNAIWAAHRWVGEKLDPSEYDALAAQLRDLAISDVYFHVGPMDGDGRIPAARRPYVEALIENMRRAAPDLRLHAWIGQVEAKGGGPLDLADPATRANVVATAAQFIEFGFDGIHYNVEPIFPDDRNWIALLEATSRLTRPAGKLLSISGDEIEPFPWANLIARQMAPRGRLWTTDYYREVASHCDQIAVMTYDTALPADWLYGAFVAWETRRLRDAVGPDVTLFVGVPSYEDDSWAFDPAVENMRSGLGGVIRGLGDDPASNVGVAIYAHWTTDAAEWAIYRRLWLGLQPGAGPSSAVPPATN